MVILYCLSKYFTDYPTTLHSLCPPPESTAILHRFIVVGAIFVQSCRIKYIYWKIWSAISVPVFIHVEVCILSSCIPSWVIDWDTHLSRPWITCYAYHTFPKFRDRTSVYPLSQSQHAFGRWRFLNSYAKSQKVISSCRQLLKQRHNLNMKIELWGSKDLFVDEQGQLRLQVGGGREFTNFLNQ